MVAAAEASERDDGSVYWATDLCIGRKYYPDRRFRGRSEARRAAAETRRGICSLPIDRPLYWELRTMHDAWMIEDRC